MKKEHRNKMIAPIIIAAVLIVYYVAIAAVFMLIPDLTVIMKLLMVIIPLALAGVAFAVTLERVQEIRSGEEGVYCQNPQCGRQAGGLCDADGKGEKSLLSSQGFSQKNDTGTGKGPE